MPSCLPCLPCSSPPSPPSPPPPSPPSPPCQPRCRPRPGHWPASADRQQLSYFLKTPIYVFRRPGPNDPENPDFSGMVDFSSATPGPDGSWCITKVSLLLFFFCHHTFYLSWLPSKIFDEYPTSSIFGGAQVKYVDHMEQDQVKECWHQNVTQCHDTYITEFLPR